VPFTLLLGSSSDDPSILKEAIKDADTVYIIVTPDILRGTEGDMKQTNVNGIQQLIQACQEVGVAKLVHVSSFATANHFVDHVKEDETAALPDPGICVSV
jgi:nucleoside-diphosphate-sugar epimerase